MNAGYAILALAGVYLLMQQRAPARTPTPPAPSLPAGQGPGGDGAHRSSINQIAQGAGTTLTGIVRLFG